MARHSRRVAFPPRLPAVAGRFFDLEDLSDHGSHDGISDTVGAEYDCHMQREPVHPSADADADAPRLPKAVDADLPCMKCGYSLRGLGTSGNCPECGTAIAASLLLPITKVRAKLPREDNPRARRAGCLIGVLILGLLLLAIWTSIR